MGEGISLEDFYHVLGLCGSLIQGAFFVEDHPEETPTALPTTLYHLTTLTITRYCLPEPGNCYSRPRVERGTGVPDMPCANVSFPALSVLRVFGDDISFATFGNLTRLTAVGVGFPYKLDHILNGCPLLFELVASISLSGKEAPLDLLVYDPDRPKGAFLQFIALVCVVNYGDIYGYSKPLREIVVSRSPNQSTFRGLNPANLKRFIIRYQAFRSLWWQADSDPVGRQQAELGTLIANMGVEVSVQIVSEGTHNYRPRLDRNRIKHWDSGVMDMLEDRWEFTTSIGPPGPKTLYSLDS
ncbi:hypothetical protein NMY22_g17798 [Coprinellus aureogranulatus]|nr:hypothetical protein NMY22_g17798 [Coprinellus aureogranulatus]